MNGAELVVEKPGGQCSAARCSNAAATTVTHSDYDEVLTCDAHALDITVGATRIEDDLDEAATSDKQDIPSVSTPMRIRFIHNETIDCIASEHREIRQLLKAHFGVSS